MDLSSSGKKNPESTYRKRHSSKSYLESFSLLSIGLGKSEGCSKLPSNKAAGEKKPEA